MMGHIGEALGSQPRALDELREALAKGLERAREDMEHMQRSIGSLNAAASSSGTAIEGTAQKLASLGHKVRLRRVVLFAFF